MSNIIRVGLADMNICRAPDKITTVGLGSCVGVVIYDTSSNIAGLAHIMLPDSTKMNNNSNKLKFADTGIDMLMTKLKASGIRKDNLKSKIAGGAAMFNYLLKSSIGNVGENNVAAVKDKLKALNIPIVAEDVGLNYGRTIIFDPVSCELTIVRAGNDRYII
ncbi:MAG: chemotaxis protein CheD [Lachnospiraceae bacterium]|nr:chemotaxis protein CheD [Lachnospiraceae bacterium]